MRLLQSGIVFFAVWAFQAWLYKIGGGHIEEFDQYLMYIISAVFALTSYAMGLLKDIDE